MNIEFSRNLIKGRIAEVIFEQMMRESGRFTIIPFGYEHTVPTLAQYQHLALVSNVMKKIKDAPDFLLISEDRKDVGLVEVKFQSVLDFEHVLSAAEKLAERWGESWIFVATPEMFLCGKCTDIISKRSMVVLPETWARKAVQDEYLKLLNEFRATQN